MSDTNRIHRSNLANQTDPYSDEWLNEGYDSSEAYSEENVTFMSDVYLESEGYSSAPMSASMTGLEAAEQIRTLFDQVKKDSNFSNEDKNKLLKELRSLFEQVRSYGAKPIPSAFLSELSMLEASSFSSAPLEEIEEQEAGFDSEAFKKDLLDYKTQVQNNPNLSETKKQQYLSKMDQWISGIDLKTLDAETIQPLFDEMKDEVTQASAFSPAIQSLSEATDLAPEEIQQAFEAKGLNASHLPNPPTQRVLEVLSSLSDELSNKLQTVKDTTRARRDEIRKQTEAAKAQNASNTACSSDNDNTDLKAFQFLYDAKHHQDQFSKDAASAMRDAVSTLTTLLQAAYPEQNISAVTGSEGEGFNDIEKDYATAGLISFNGAKIDLFKAEDGSFQASSTIDKDADVEVVSVKYDWEGSGDWEDSAGRPSLTLYGEEMQRSKYDTGW